MPKITKAIISLALSDATRLPRTQKGEQKAEEEGNGKRKRGRAEEGQTGIGY